MFCFSFCYKWETEKRYSFIFLTMIITAIMMMMMKKGAINMFNKDINFWKNLSHKYNEYSYYLFTYVHFITSHRIFINDFK